LANGWTRSSIHKYGVRHRRTHVASDSTRGHVAQHGTSTASARPERTTSTSTTATAGTTISNQPTTNGDYNHRRRTARDADIQEDMNCRPGVMHSTKFAISVLHLDILHAVALGPQMVGWAMHRHVIKNRTSARLGPVRVGENLFLINEPTPIQSFFLH